nr:cell division protein ZapD [Dongshaea marina]
MPLHTFENPLNEKSRIYLRLEYLFAQLFDNCEQQQSWQHLAFFKALFELQELLERGDPRMELLKDLEKQSQKLALWSQYPGIDRELVDQLETRLHSAQQNLPRMARAIQHLKEDKLLGAIRPRFNIPGGVAVLTCRPFTCGLVRIASFNNRKSASGSMDYVL